jgi:sortase A
MKKHLSTILLVLALLVGAALLLYPTASDYWNSLHQSRAIATYAEEVANLTTADYEKLWLAAVEYNKRMGAAGNPFVLSEEQRADYFSQLDLSGNGIMGYIEIPKIECSLPIYHGTSEAVLQIAVGHLEGSTLPVGGAGTHCVLSGHRGLPSAKLFTHLDQLSEGDVFLLRVLNETLTYEVDQIHIVLPQEVDDLAVVPGRDFCTLVTCTPYGINSHRLLVRGKRIENSEAATAIRITSDAIRIDPILVAPVAAVPMLLILTVYLIANPGGKKKKKKKKAG